VLLFTYLFQSSSVHNTDSGVEKLLEILSRRDSSLLPVFCQSLVETDQPHVAKKLGYRG